MREGLWRSTREELWRSMKEDHLFTSKGRQQRHILPRDTDHHYSSPFHLSLLTISSPSTLLPPSHYLPLSPSLLLLPPPPPPPPSPPPSCIPTPLSSQYIPRSLLSYFPHLLPSLLASPFFPSYFIPHLLLLRSCLPPPSHARRETEEGWAERG